ncbi:5-methyltetrahydropteroyltriglutamate--homocysteine S-methyltransferase, partial [candidate division KSB1 bacterium]|nr:5-methyltetrahydropteroyltriglutamate--homocysteine S-methyltransferase [candidate division KSB1 bacterium]
MTLKTQILGYPRIGAKRELKKAVEAYWKGTISREELEKTSSELKQIHWQKQQAAGINFIPSNDFSYYDHVLDTIGLVGAVPARFEFSGDRVDLDLYFTMARGVRPGQSGEGTTQAMEMTKWLNTNYHYIVPEFQPNQQFKLACHKPAKDFKLAQELGIQTQPVLLGPISLLLLGKTIPDFEVLDLLDRLLPVYEQILKELKEAGATRIQFDEPVLALDLTARQRAVFLPAYRQLKKAAPDLAFQITAYFAEYRENLAIVMQLPVDTVHLDAVYAGNELEKVLETLPADKSLSLGVVNGRNIWKNNYETSLQQLRKAVQRLGAERVIVSSSCSLMFSPVSLAYENELDAELKNWLAYADEKLVEISDLARLAVLSNYKSDPVYLANQAAHDARRKSPRIHVPAVKARSAAVTPAMTQRQSPFQKRIEQQQARLNLPIFPTTTIGSFPQTADIRKNRANFKSGKISAAEYEKFLETEIKKVVEFQEKMELDVLVHGESERNDMVEYFGEQLQGFAFTENGWVQSYGSRCVKPPIIYGDVHRPEPMTVRWSKYAQSLTGKPMKGMLTGPVTILQWSFVRDDQPRAETTKQIALAIRDEVVDLEKAGIPVIQIDEPALREGLPLRRSDWAYYLNWSVEAFRISAAGVRDETQIHTHMCYSEFNQIIDAIAAMDADVISIEASRSKMELLQAFVDFVYPNQIGPGVWDIHSPRVPSVEEMVELLTRAAKVL